MLLILPPSETKRPAPPDGPPVDLDDLSFPALRPMRSRVLTALVATSAEPDALRRLQVGPSLVHEVLRNLAVRESPAGPALEVYAGPLHVALSASTLSEAAARRAATNVVVVSSLWGLLRPADRIPPYRLHVCSRLVGLDRLEPTWRAVLPPVLSSAAGRDGLVLDLRSPSYQAVGMPAVDPERVVGTRVVRRMGGRGLGDVIAKRTRGEAARLVLESGADPREPQALAEVLGSRWAVELAAPDVPGRPAMLTIAVED